MQNPTIDINLFKVKEGNKIKLKDFDPGFCAGFKNKNEAKKQLSSDIELLNLLQYRLYAENKQALLIVFQAMDAAGKDGAIKHVFSGLNPQGCSVSSFKTPSTNELEHDFLWRHYKQLPARGNIGIFNRSHYENVLITKVHPEYILNENLKNINKVKDINKDFWEDRYTQIINFEKNIVESGTKVIKFFLHLSKKEQKKRFMERIDNKEKNWKFSSADIKERGYWDNYQEAYETAINKTSTKAAPWFIVPADHKWYTRVIISHIIVDTLKKMDIQMPKLSDEEKMKLEQAKQQLQDDK